MRTRLWIAVVTVFWLVMSVLLWRSEFGHHRPFASTVPAPMVWQKMLTAPDASNLEIWHGTNRVGYGRWRSDVGQEIATGALLSEDDPIEGLVPRLAYYTLDFDGNVTLPDFPGRVRFSLALRLDTNRVWQTLDARVMLRPDAYELSVNAPAETARVHVDAGGDRFDRVFRFADFQNPQKLLQEFGGPMMPMMAASLGVPLATNQFSAASLGLHWEARNDFIMAGRNRVRAYRLQARLFDLHRITFFVSPVGEILRAELPGNLILVNEALAGLRTTTNPHPEDDTQ